MSSSPDVSAYIYELHLKGNSARAYALALSTLQHVLPVTDFSFEGGLHRLAVVTGLATARSLEFDQALPIFIEIVTRIINSYPLDKDKKEAERKNIKWEGVYKDHNAQVACARDVLHVLVEIYGFTKNAHLSRVIGKIKKTLLDFYHRNDSGSFALIQFVCEDGDWEEAKRAYQKAESFKQIDSTGFIITTARMMGRAKDEGEEDYSKRLEDALNALAIPEDPQKQQLIKDQINKNTSQANNRKARLGRWDIWTKEWEGKDHESALALFRQLAAVEFMGLGTQYGVVRL